MNSEKVKEIKKALECCSEGKCEKCLIGKKDIRKCVDILLKDTLTLINELESENQQLKDGIAKSMLGCEFLPECTKEKEKEVAEDFIKEIGKIQLQEYNGAELCLMLDLSQVLKKLAKKYGAKIGE